MLGLVSNSSIWNKVLLHTMDKLKKQAEPTQVVSTNINTTHTTA